MKKYTKKQLARLDKLWSSNSELVLRSNGDFLVANPSYWVEAWERVHNDECIDAYTRTIMYCLDLKYGSKEYIKEFNRLRKRFKKEHHNQYPRFTIKKGKTK